jgi:hypothetical protein
MEKNPSSRPYFFISKSAVYEIKLLWLRRFRKEGILSLKMHVKGTETCNT